MPRAPGTQGDSSLRELGWVLPLSLSHPGRGRGEEGEVLVGSYGAIVGTWGRESFLGHFTSTSIEIERADIALDLYFKN